MIVANEVKHTKTTLAITLIVMAVVAIFIINAVLSAPVYYAAPGSNTETWGAPNGIYLQKDWGSFDNQTLTWSFAMCDHDYLGPLHGSWPVKAGVWVPVLNQVGVYPFDARLYITIENNIIVKAEVKSAYEYGN